VIAQAETVDCPNGGNVEVASTAIVAFRSEARAAGACASSNFGLRGDRGAVTAVRSDRF
jgi:hypothetical protein